MLRLSSRRIASQCRRTQQSQYFHTSKIAFYSTNTAPADDSSSTSPDSKKSKMSSLTDTAEPVKLPPLHKINRSSQHASILASAQQKVASHLSRYQYMRDSIIPLRQLYFSAAEHFPNAPNSPAKRIKGVIPDYTQYFPASVGRYDQTGMGLTESQVHKKFQKWWMATTGRGPPKRGAEKDKSKKKKRK